MAEPAGPPPMITTFVGSEVIFRNLKSRFPRLQFRLPGRGGIRHATGRDVLHFWIYQHGDASGCGKILSQQLVIFHSDVQVALEKSDEANEAKRIDLQRLSRVRNRRERGA